MVELGAECVAHACNPSTWGVKVEGSEVHVVFLATV